MTEPYLVRCINSDCKKEFDISNGYILLHICPECLRKQARAPAFIERGRLLVPNPEAA